MHGGKLFMVKVMGYSTASEVCFLLMKNIDNGDQYITGAVRMMTFSFAPVGLIIIELQM